tara:strand:- start:6831 stop:6983 length:153 start_codon:yes stop_codon:yes gene_type:complete
MIEAQKMIQENPKIRQINIYQAIQEIEGFQRDRQLIHFVVREGFEPIRSE